MLRKSILTGYFILTIVASFSQISMIDSLIKTSKTLKSDTARIQLFLKIGHEFHNSNKKDSALFYFDKAEKLALILSRSKKSEQKETGSRLLAQCYSSKAFSQYEDMNFSSSEENYNKALLITEHLIKYSDNYYIITEAQKLNTNIYSGIANIYTDKGYYSIALINFLKAQEITDSLIKKGFLDENESAAQYFHLGLIHYYLGNLTKSLEYYKKSLDISEKFNNKSGIAKINSNIGIIETKMNHTKKALKYFKKALKYAEKENIEILKAQIYDNMADCYMKQKDFHNAEIYLAKAMIITEKLNSKQGKIYILLGLADVYNQTEKYTKALNNTNQALLIAQEMQSISFIRDIYRQIYEIYENQQQYKKALNYYKKYKILEDSIFTKEKMRQIQDNEAKYQASKKQEEINRQKLEISKRDNKIKIKNTQNYIFGAIAFFLSVFILIIFITLKQKQRINKLIEKQTKKITDSIEYAKKIQTAALPSEKVLSKLFDKHFILFKPLQIVSGDFYWAVRKDNFIVFAAADCTGHGIPGAFVSMLGISFLNELTLISDLTRPDLILEEMRFILKKSFRQTGNYNEQSDGIDISLCSINTETDELFFAGANNSAYLVINNKFTELEAVPNPVGVYYKEVTFKMQTVKLKKGDTIYLFTDGYADQFGGNNRKLKKYTLKRFKDLLSDINKEPILKQKELLENEFQNWKKHSKQIDDILIFGIKY